MLIRNIVGNINTRAYYFANDDVGGVFTKETYREMGAYWDRLNAVIYKLNASNSVPTADETRGYNFNIKLYIKL